MDWKSNRLKATAQLAEAPKALKAQKQLRANPPQSAGTADRNHDEVRAIYHHSNGLFRLAIGTDSGALASLLTTAKRLRVTCRLDHRKYPTRRRITAEEMKQVNICPDKFHGARNYVIKPHPIQP